ncbi:uncharacterized protein LOC135211243 isoform X4 [Macrobrachium nipponense]|uniref:uncharacterized protein LOC135211243 isoform X4 n=1 Tax=Macrobrachium nipponense TaxID=159736 RepID=UPI0030C8C755
MDSSELERSPKSWGDVRLVVLGDSLIGGLSFKEIPAEDRPKLRARSFKGARLHKLLPMVEPEITKFKPDILVLSIGRGDLAHLGCQHFPKADHQHHVYTISYDFSVKVAAAEIFQQWHSWLSKYNCRVLIALTYPIDFQEYNSKKLQHCPECKDEYIDDGKRDIMIKRIQEWGNLLTEQDVPVMYLDDVLRRINPDYMETDAIIEESDRALIDGMKPSKKFAQNFYAVIREATEKFFPDFMLSENNPVEHDSGGSDDSSLTEKRDDVNGDDAPPVLPPPKKKPKPAFRF